MMSCSLLTGRKTSRTRRHKVSGGSYEYFEGMGLPDLISESEEGRRYTVRLCTTRRKRLRSHRFSHGLRLYSFRNMLTTPESRYAGKSGSRTRSALARSNWLPAIRKTPAFSTKLLTALGHEAADRYWSSPSRLTLTLCVTPNYRRTNVERYLRIRTHGGYCAHEEDKASTDGAGGSEHVGYLSYNVQKKPLDDVKGFAGR